MNITIANPDQAEVGHLGKCLQKLAQYVNQAESATVFCYKRALEEAYPYQNPGWIEYLIAIKFLDGSALTIWAIQRTKDSEIEFHS